MTSMEAEILRSRTCSRIQGSVLYFQRKQLIIRLNSKSGAAYKLKL